MNVSYGGAQKKLRSTIVDSDCLGENPAVMKWKGKTIDCKLKPCSTQSMIFKAGDPPPFYFPDCRELDSVNPKKPTKQLTNAGKKRAVSKRQKVVSSASAVLAATAAATAATAAAQAAANINDTDIAQDIENIIDGYIGKAKGKRQVIWERGLWKDWMTAGNIDPNMNLDRILSNCRDFREEKSALQALVEDRGHILVMSVKGSPELAGAGVEYTWGKGKLEFRREINDGVPAHLFDNIKKVLSTDVIPLSRVRKYARKTRDYRRVYARPADDPGQSNYAMVEKMRKKRKTHRNILDLESRFLIHS
eukprot:Lithocolla_globosa_v1_NODE_1497_length_2534_cov_3.916935.p1 type:complete len:306 gc:universal NODE_1497_length_2534_cov_3.916935:1441-524(-)